VTQNNTSGSDNNAYGFRVLYANTTGHGNTAVGDYDLTNNVDGNYNSSFGSSALFNNTNGNFNSGFGERALLDNTTGTNNTGCGNNTLAQNATGSFNTALGDDADVNTDGLTNTTVIGAGTTGTASNQIYLGNGSVTGIMAAVNGITAYSDGRFKKDIQANVPGLDFIRELRPVTYHYNIHGINNYIGNTKKPVSIQNDKAGNGEDQSAGVNQKQEAAITAKEKILYTGFVAQEVEAAANKFKYDFSGIHKPRNEKDLYGLSYSDFVVPLVKAVQELSAENDSKQDEIDSLKIRLKRLEDMMLGSSSGSVSLSDATLGQNTPNPFAGSTNINYTLPQNFGHARLMVTDISGRIIKTVMINGTGRGNLNIDASGLSSGVYNYTLYVDEKMISSKQMVLTK